MDLGTIIGFKVLSGLTTGLGTALATKLSGAGGAGGKGGGIFGSIGKAINSIKPQNVLAVAAAMLIMATAMYVSAKAFQEFATVSWPDVVFGLLTLGALALTAKVMSKGSMAMIKGAAAILVLSIALIPLAFALNLMKGVGLETVFVVAGALTVLGIAQVS